MPWVLLLAGTIAYHGSLQAPFIFDDQPGIVENVSLHRLSWDLILPGAMGGSSVAGRPLVNLSLALNHAISGQDVWSYHALNLLIHLGAGLVLCALVRQTFRLPALRTTDQHTAAAFAFAVALLWLVHPLQTESVTCVIQRTESLHGLLLLAALLSFARSLTAPHPARWRVATLALALLGAATKEVIVVLPVLAWLYDRTFAAGSFAASWQRQRRFFLVLAVVTWLPVLASVLHSESRGGTVGFGHGVAWWEYALTQCRALALYLQLSFWPAPLVLDYGNPVVRDLTAVWPQALLLFLLLAATAWALVRRPVAGFLGAWFFIILAPSSSVVPLVTQTIAEHRMYLPLAAVVAGLLAIIRQLGTRALLVGASLMGAGLLLVTLDRNQLYRSPLALWEQNLVHAPPTARLLNNLGLALCHEGQPDLARRQRGIAMLEEAIRLDPRNAEAHANLGNACGTVGRLHDAVSHLAAALALAPHSAAFHASYGNALLDAGRPEQAARELATARTLDPGLANLSYNTANALAALGRDPEAAAEYEAALRQNPRDAEAHANYANLLRRLQRLPAALQHARAAVACAPASANAHNTLAIALMLTGQPQEALEHFRAAAQLAPEKPESRRNLATALARTGHPDEALREFQTLLTLAPPTAEVHNNLGAVYAQLGRLEEARGQFSAALRLDPQNASARENLARTEAALARRR